MWAAVLLELRIRAVQVVAEFRQAVAQVVRGELQFVTSPHKQQVEVSLEQTTQLQQTVFTLCRLGFPLAL
jgi:hypothetical protein